MSPRRFRLVLGAIVMLALVLRLVLAVGVSPTSIDGDPAFYDRAGVRVAEGRGWPRMSGAEHATALHPPGWPYTLGAAYAVAGTESDEARWRAGRVVNALFGAGAVALLGLLGLALFSAVVGLVAAGLYAVYPPPAILGTTLLSEPLFVFLLLAAILATLRASGACREGVDISTPSRHAPGRAWRWIVGAGVLVGLAALTRPNGILLLAPLAFALGSWRRAAALAAAAVLTIAPWTIRNYVVMDAFVPVASNTGKTLAGTYNPTARTFRYRWITPALLPRSYRPALRKPAEPERSSALTTLAVDYIKDDPLSVPKAFVWNTARLAELESGGRTILRNVLRSDGLANLSFAGFGLMALLAAGGLFTRRFREAPRWFWLTPVLFYVSAALIAVNFSRFRGPIEPFIVLAAALAVVALTERATRARLTGSQPH
jgi:4-amino-4-deoxy-L-arabinose transferase-like glycosyltransferase